jgi:hypothetical protein
MHASKLIKTNSPWNLKYPKKDNDLFKTRFLSKYYSIFNGMSVKIMNFEAMFINEHENSEIYAS